MNNLIEHAMFGFLEKRTRHLYYNILCQAPTFQMITFIIISFVKYPKRVPAKIFTLQILQDQTQANI